MEERNTGWKNASLKDGSGGEKENRSRVREPSWGIWDTAEGLAPAESSTGNKSQMNSNHEHEASLDVLRE